MASRDNFIAIGSVTPNHLSRSIIITRGGIKPAFMNSQRLRSNRWPTPAMATYNNIVSHELANFYWTILEKHHKKKLLRFICLEFMYQGMGRIYKRHHTHNHLLVKLNYEEFETIVLKRLTNLRYNTSGQRDTEPFHHTFSTFTEGETVNVESRGNQMFEGTYQYDSVINNNFVYIKFESRTHVVMWEKRLVHHVDIRLTSNERRATRQLARMQSLAERGLQFDIDNENLPRALEVEENRVQERRVIEINDNGTESEESSQEGDDNHPANNPVRRIPNRNAQNGNVVLNRNNSERNNADGRGNVAGNVERENGVIEQRRRPLEDIDLDNRNVRRRRVEYNRADLFVDSSDEDSSVENDRDNNGDGVARAGNIEQNISDDSSDEDGPGDDGVPGGWSYENLIRRFGYGNENRRRLDRQWLTSKGLIANVTTEAMCTICCDTVHVGAMIYNIDCACPAGNRFHRECIERFVEAGNSTMCPNCRTDFLEE